MFTYIVKANTVFFWFVFLDLLIYLFPSTDAQGVHQTNEDE